MVRVGEIEFRSCPLSPTDQAIRAIASSLVMHIDRRAERRPIPEIAGVVEQQIDAAVAAGAADRLFGPPPGKMERMPKVGEVLGEEHVVEPEVVLRADRPG